MNTHLWRYHKEQVVGTCNDGSKLFAQATYEFHDLGFTLQKDSLVRDWSGFIRYDHFKLTIYSSGLGTCRKDLHTWSASGKSTRESFTLTIGSGKKWDWHFLSFVIGGEIPFHQRKTAELLTNIRTHDTTGVVENDHSYHTMSGGTFTGISAFAEIKVGPTKEAQF